MDNLSFRHFILLHLLHRLQGDRTIYSLYHILTGKKSSQTIQDIKWYKVTPYFRLFPYWNSSLFEEDIKSLRSNGLYEEQGGRAHLTSRGKSCVAHYNNYYLWPSYFNGWKYGEASIQFWKRLALYVQSLSHSLKSSRTFLPVFKDFETQLWVKKHWPLQRSDKLKTAEILHQEISALLHFVPEEDACIFMSRLSGYNLTGYTLQQISEQINCSDMDELYYRFQNVLHFLFANSKSYSALRLFTSDLLKSKMLTTTASKTHTYLKEGWNIREIAEKRQLKVSTIEDHIVEIASEDDTFPINQYVSPESQKEIIYIAKKIGTYRLKMIKESLQSNEEADYFSIRLTLACYGGNYGENT